MNTRGVGIRTFFFDALLWGYGLVIGLLTGLLWFIGVLMALGIVGDVFLSSGVKFMPSSQTLALLLAAVAAVALYTGIRAGVQSAQMLTAQRKKPSKAPIED